MLDEISSIHLVIALLSGRCASQDTKFSFIILIYVCNILELKLVTIIQAVCTSNLLIVPFVYLVFLFGTPSIKYLHKNFLFISVLLLIFTSCKDDGSPVVIPPVSPNPDGLLVEFKVLPNGDLEALKDDFPTNFEINEVYQLDSETHL
tara:strand:- start:345 stop:788 length:444 start_codon:yes stop_codon:yes gene_type:complete